MRAECSMILQSKLGTIKHAAGKVESERISKRGFNEMFSKKRAELSATL